VNQLIKIDAGSIDRFVLVAFLHLMQLAQEAFECPLLQRSGGAPLSTSVWRILLDCSHHIIAAAGSDSNSAAASRSSRITQA